MNGNKERVRVGVIGLGFMGKTHVRAYLRATEAGYPCELVAVADPNESNRTGSAPNPVGNIDSGDSQLVRLFDPDRVRGYATARELVADPDIDLVSVCTQTDLHVAHAGAALEAGKHVLVEKPVALRADDIRKLDVIARRAGRICMPAMCMRFWPGWDWLKARIADREYGSCVSLVIQRLTSPPAWSVDFYSDGKRSGGAIVDLHIHDTDFIRCCFGNPDSVSSAGRVGDTGAIDHLTTIYRYERGNGPAHVVAEGGWDHASGFTFLMRYVAIFEHATATFDSSRQASPLALVANGKHTSILLEPLTGYDNEIRHIVNAVASGKRSADVTLDDAVAVVELLDAERRSADRREGVRISAVDRSF